MNCRSTVVGGPQIGEYVHWRPARGDRCLPALVLEVRADGRYELEVRDSHGLVMIVHGVPRDDTSALPASWHPLPEQIP